MAKGITKAKTHFWCVCNCSWVFICAQVGNAITAMTTCLPIPLYPPGAISSWQEVLPGCILHIMGYSVISFTRTVLNNGVGAFPTGRIFHSGPPAWFEFLSLLMSLVCHLYIFHGQLIRSEQKFESRKNAELCLSSANEHWVETAFWDWLGISGYIGNFKS